MERLIFAKSWWESGDMMRRLDVEGLLPLTCGANWNELDEWEKEVIAQHMEEAVK